MENKKTIDELATAARRDDIGRVVLGGGVVVYVIALVVGVVRNLELFGGSFRQTGYEWIGLLGVAALGINAVVLPLFLHYRASGAQYYATLVAYAVDLAILFLNAVLDARQVQSRVVEGGFAQFYYDNILFATPVVVMGLWALLFALDPASGLQRAISEANAAMLGTLKRKITGATRTVEVDRAIEDQARKFAEEMSKVIMPAGIVGTLHPTPTGGFVSKNTEVEAVPVAPPQVKVSGNGGVLPN